MLLTDEIFTIYESIKPTLLKIANTYKINNRVQFVNEWQASAYFIARKFDNRELCPKFAAGGMLLETSSQDLDFLRQFRGYLKTAFRNDLTEEYKKQKKHSYIDENSPDYIAGVTFIEYCDSATIDHIAKAVRHDLASGRQNIRDDRMRQLFLLSILSAVEIIRPTWDKLPVIKDIGETNKNKYFDQDFEQDFREAIRVAFIRETLNLTCPKLFKKAADIALSDNNASLQRKIYSYFYEFDGGLQTKVANTIKGPLTISYKKAGKTKPLTELLSQLELTKEDFIALAGLCGKPIKEPISNANMPNHETIEAVKSHLFSQIGADSIKQKLNLLLEKIGAGFEKNNDNH